MRLIAPSPADLGGTPNLEDSMRLRSLQHICCALFATFAFSSVARAWEPSDSPSIAARTAEVQAALNGKDPGAIAADKLARARQAKPSWADKSSFKIEGGGKSYLLGVGLTKSMPAPSMTVGVAEAKARSNLAATKPGGSAVQRGPGTITVSSSGTVKGDALDWWLAPDGTFYALVAEESAAAADAAKPPDATK